MGTARTAPRGQLYTTTLNMLRNRPRFLTFIEISKRLENANCPSVTVTWLHNLSIERIEKPDVDRIEALYELLSGQSLQVH